MPVSDIDESWLKENVFNLLPEVVGSLWDEETSGHEVAAVLARMEIEGKLSTRIQKDVLHLGLLVDRSTLKEYEKTLVDTLFFNDKNVTDTRQ